MRKVEFDRMQDLRSMISAVAFAASTDDEQPDMNGVGLEVFDGELYAMATNSEWAMRVRRKPIYAAEGFKVLVPLSYVRRLVALIGDGIGRLWINQEQDLVRFEVEKIGRVDLDTGGVAAIQFVDLDKVWPTGDALPMEMVDLNPSLMASLGKAFGQFVAKPTLRFAFHGQAHPIVVTCEEKEYADALLMPCALEGAADDDDEGEERQRKLSFIESEPEERPRARLAQAAVRLRDEFGADEVTISSGGASVKLKGKSSPKVSVKKRVEKRPKRKAK